MVWVVRINYHLECLKQRTSQILMIPILIRQPMVGKGIYFFGNDKKTKDELWFTNDDMRTHALIFGSTGSGKTVSLVGISYNALVQSSGFIYVDGMGDNTLFATLFGMAKFMGRLDDFLLINFMTGARDISGAQEKIIVKYTESFCLRFFRNAIKLNCEYDGLRWFGW